ncbi:MAG: nitroreductase family protein [Candidatus Thorarchaeota archaeon]|nr:nitroreductase family protein [Candidatus Thorarchaeota archaeon]
MILKLIEAARWAPSAKNGQQWRFTVLTGNSKKALLDEFRGALEKLSEKIGRKEMGSALPSCSIMEKAAVLIVVWNAGTFGWITEEHSVAAAVEHLLLKAHDLGLGGLWIGDVWYTPEVFSEYLKKDWKLFGALSIGWPDEGPDPRPRKSVDEIVEFLR